MKRSVSNKCEKCWISKASCLAVVGVVSSVRLHPGREDDHGGGRQGVGHRVAAAAGLGSVHEHAAQSRQQPSDRRNNYNSGGSAEPQAGQNAAASSDKCSAVFTFYLLKDHECEFNSD